MKKKSLYKLLIAKKAKYFTLDILFSGPLSVLSEMNWVIGRTGIEYTTVPKNI